MKNRESILIVGGGTAGLTIASELADDYQILVVEASEESYIPLYLRIPLMVGQLFKRTRYSVLKEFFYHKRRIPFYESRVWGGASVINGAVHVYGSEDSWRALLDKFKIKFDLIEGFHKQTFSFTEADGRIKLREAFQDRLDRAFQRALAAKKIPTGDTASFESEVCGPVINTCKTYFRSSVRDFSNVGVETLKGVRVDGLIVNNDCVAGVRTSVGDLYADKVVLAAGVLGTLDILKKSSHNIPRGNRKLLGLGLRDHSNLRINVKTHGAGISLNSINSKFYSKVLLAVSYLLRMPSVMSGSGATSAANIALDRDAINFRLNLLRFYESGRGLSSGGLLGDGDAGFSLSITQVNPRSAFHIHEGDWFPNYASDDCDITFLKKALVYCLELLESPPLNSHVLEILDLDQIKNDPVSYIKENVFSGYHLAGGCSDLVDHNFAVKGISNLFVCDASVINRYPSSNIHSTVVLLAKVFAHKQRRSSRTS